MRLRELALISLAAFVAAGCMTGQRRKEPKAQAVSAVEMARRELESAVQAGAPIYASSLLRSAQSDLETAQRRLNEGRYEDAVSLATLANSQAVNARATAEAAKRNEAPRKEKPKKKG